MNNKQLLVPMVTLINWAAEIALKKNKQKNIWDKLKLSLAIDLKEKEKLLNWPNTI